jgi:hypothetical protein
VLQVCKDSTKIAIEQLQGIMTQVTCCASLSFVVCRTCAAWPALHTLTVRQQTFE